MTSRLDVLLFFTTWVGPAFTLGAVCGWFLHVLHIHRYRGYPMVRQTRTEKVRPLDAFGGWFAQGHRLVAFVVIIGLIATGAFAYTVFTGKQSSSRDERNFSCLVAFVSETNRAQAPRTVASTKASDARRDWDRGYSRDQGAENLSKDQLFDRYQRLYDEYVRVRDLNPLPVLSPTYCESVR